MAFFSACPSVAKAVRMRLSGQSGSLGRGHALRVLRIARDAVVAVELLYAKRAQQRGIQALQVDGRAHAAEVHPAQDDPRLVVDENKLGDLAPDAAAAAMLVEDLEPVAARPAVFHA